MFFLSYTNTSAANMHVGSLAFGFGDSVEPFCCILPRRKRGISDGISEMQHSLETCICKLWLLSTAGPVRRHYESQRLGGTAVMERLRQQAFMSSPMRRSCRHLGEFVIWKMIHEKKTQYLHVELTHTSSYFPSRRVPQCARLHMTAAHLQQNASFCLNYHRCCDKRIESQQIMFTSRTELIKASLGCCDAPFYICG